MPEDPPQDKLQISPWSRKAADERQPFVTSFPEHPVPQPAVTDLGQIGRDNAATPAQPITDPGRHRLRRMMTIGVPVLVAGLAAGAVVGRETKGEKPIPKDPYKPEHVYRSGETIHTPAGDVVINGWQFLFDPAQYIGFGQKHPGVDFHYTIDSPLGIPGQARKLGMQGGELFADRQFEQSNHLGKTLDSHRIFPPGEIIRTGLRPDSGAIVYMHFAALRDKEVFYSGSYPVNLDYTTYKRNPDEPAVVYSESGVDASFLAEIDSSMRSYKPFLQGLPFVYLYANAVFDDRDGTRYSDGGNNIMFQRESFTKPIFQNEGFVRLGRKLATAMFSRSYERLSGQEHPFYRAHADIQAVTPDTKVPIMQAPVMRQIYDLNYYVRSDGQFAYFGNNPYLFMGSLFSSAATIFKFYPTQFMNAFRGLKPEQRPLVKAVADRTLEIIESLKPVDDNTNITALIPNALQIRALVA